MAKRAGNVERTAKKFGSVDSLRVPIDDDNQTERRLSFSRRIKKNG